jgi:hypothetical protein
MKIQTLGERASVLLSSIVLNKKGTDNKQERSFKAADRGSLRHSHFLVLQTAEERNVRFGSIADIFGRWQHPYFSFPLVEGECLEAGLVIRPLLPLVESQ